MNWDAIGAVAVFVTLGYLAVQIRHARSEARRGLSQGRGEAIRDLAMLGTDERINRLMVKAEAALGKGPGQVITTLMDRTGLTQEEAGLIFQYQLSYWSYQIQVIPNITELPAIERHQIEIGILGRYAEGSVGRLYYETMKSRAHPDLVRYIDNLLAQPG